MQGVLDKYDEFSSTEEGRKYLKTQYIAILQYIKHTEPLIERARRNFMAAQQSFPINGHPPMCTWLVREVDAFPKAANSKHMPTPTNERA